MCQTHLLEFIYEDFGVSSMVTFCGGPGVWVFPICILRVGHFEEIWTHP